MPNWTTGPWKAEPCVDMAGFETGKLWIIMRSQPMAYDFDRWEDARLAASAPDLLEALHGLNGILGTAESNASGTPEWEHVSAKVNAARKAIAKALGEQS